MSPSESRSGSNPNRVRIFGPDKLVRAAAEKRWDRVKIVCSQPYSKVPGVKAEACPGKGGGESEGPILCSGGWEQQPATAQVPSSGFEFLLGRAAGSAVLWSEC